MSDDLNIRFPEERWALGMRLSEGAECVASMTTDGSEKKGLTFLTKEGERFEVGLTTAQVGLLRELLRDLEREGHDITYYHLPDRESYELCRSDLSEHDWRGNEYWKVDLPQRERVPCQGFRREKGEACREWVREGWVNAKAGPTTGFYCETCFRKLQRGDGFSAVEQQQWLAARR